MKGSAWLEVVGVVVFSFFRFTGLVLGVGRKQGRLRMRTPQELVRRLSFHTERVRGPLENRSAPQLAKKLSNRTPCRY